jgi:hypothetical protein
MLPSISAVTDRTRGAQFIRTFHGDPSPTEPTVLGTCLKPICPPIDFRTSPQFSNFFDDSSFVHAQNPPASFPPLHSTSLMASFAHGCHTPMSPTKPDCDCRILPIMKSIYARFTGETLNRPEHCEQFPKSSAKDDFDP